MIHDPEIEVSCDDCGDIIYLQPEWVYSDYSGRTGRYNCDEAALEKQIEAEGWACSRGRHLCPSCQTDD